MAARVWTQLSWFPSAQFWILRLLPLLPVGLSNRSGPPQFWITIMHIYWLLTVHQALPKGSVCIFSDLILMMLMEEATFKIWNKKLNFLLAKKADLSKLFWLSLSLNKQRKSGPLCGLGKCGPQGLVGFQRQSWGCLTASSPGLVSCLRLLRVPCGRVALGELSWVDWDGLGID